MLEIKRTIAAAAAAALQSREDEIIPLFKLPDKPEWGDLSLPCFTFAKAQKKAPNAIASFVAGEIAEQIDCVATVEAAGPYLNFKAKTEPLARRVLSEAVDFSKPLNLPDIGRNSWVVIDYSSPNIAKPIAFHHIRSTVIGSSLRRIHLALGYRTLGINYLGDWGTTQGKLICAFKRWGSPESLESEGIRHLLDVYVRFHKEAETDPSLKEEAKAWFVRCESGDEEALSVWRKFREISIREFDRIYKLLGVEFDAIDGESLYHKKAEEIFELARRKAGATDSEGAFVIPLDEYKLPPVLLRKADGATLYATRDIAAAIDRYERAPFEKSLYVVGSQQALYFSQLILALKKLGFDWADKMKHAPFGMLSIKDPDSGEVTTGSTREGNLVFLEDVLNRSMELARRAVEENAAKRSAPLSEDEIKVISRQVGVGAIIFADLTNRRINDVVFDWDRMLSMQGDTGVHVQYAHARCMNMLREAGALDLTSFDASLYTREEERALLVSLSRYKETVVKAAAELEPSLLARYLLDLSGAFGKVYELFKTEGYRFLDSNENVRRARLALAAATARVIKEGLALLGVEAPERM